MNQNNRFIYKKNAMKAMKAIDGSHSVCEIIIIFCPLCLISCVSWKFKRYDAYCSLSTWLILLARGSFIATHTKLSSHINLFIVESPRNSHGDGLGVGSGKIKWKFIIWSIKKNNQLWKFVTFDIENEMWGKSIKFFWNPRSKNWQLSINIYVKHIMRILELSLDEFWNSIFASSAFVRHEGKYFLILFSDFMAPMRCQVNNFLFYFFRADAWANKFRSLSYAEYVHLLWICHCLVTQILFGISSLPVS